MGIVDLFRPKHRHSKASVRAEALRGLASSEHDILHEAARNDTDDGVRRIAIERIDDPQVLTSIANDDDSKVGAFARARALDLWIDRAAAATDVAGARAVLQHIDEPDDLATVVQRAAKPSVRKAALRQIADVKVLSELARTSDEADVRQLAVAAIEDPAVLQSLAIGGEPRDVALAAIDRLQDAEAVERVIKKARRKNLRNRARLRLAELAPPPPEPEPQGPTPEQLRLAEHVRLLAVVESAMVGREYDDADARRVEDARAQWSEIEPEDAELLARFDRAVTQYGQEREAAAVAAKRAAYEQAEARERQQAAAAREREAAKRAEGEAKRKRDAASKRAEQEAKTPAEAAENDAPAQPEPSAPDPSPEEREEQAKKNQESLEQACAELEAAAESKTVREAQAVMDRAAKVFAKPRRLPTPEMRDALQQRFEAARTEVMGVIQSLLEEEKWRDWANLGKQQSLADRAHALLANAAEEPELAKKVRELQDEWKTVSRVGAGKGEALWQRFRSACDGIYAAIKAGYADNLAAREQLCERAESYRESTDWRGAAAALKDLQAVWKTVGPVARADDARTWKRFRAACDGFFARRQEANVAIAADEEKNAERKAALIDKVEALAQSIVDERTHERAVTETKRLQSSWRDIGFAPRKAADELRTRYRAACDAVYKGLERLQRAKDEAEVARIAGLRDEVTAQLDAADVEAATLVAIWGRVHALRDEALRKRAYDACADVLAAQPGAFDGSELAPAKTSARKRKLCEGLEALVEDPAEEGRSLADQLSDALARNAIINAKERAEDLAAKVDKARAAWTRVGPTPGDEGTQLEGRFEAAAAAVLAASGA